MSMDAVAPGADGDPLTVTPGVWCCSMLFEYDWCWLALFPFILRGELSSPKKICFWDECILVDYCSLGPSMPIYSDWCWLIPIDSDAFVEPVGVDASTADANVTMLVFLWNWECWSWRVCYRYRYIAAKEFRSLEFQGFWWSCYKHRKALLIESPHTELELCQIQTPLMQFQNLLLSTFYFYLNFWTGSGG